MHPAQSMPNSDETGGGGSSAEPDNHAADEPFERRTSASEETGIRKWLANLFVHTVRAGERLLEDGQLAAAAAVFADATLLTEQAEAFAAAVHRVYPTYFCHLYEQRMLAMGYGHLFPELIDRESAVRRLSSGGRTYDDDDDDH